MDRDRKNFYQSKAWIDARTYVMKRDNYTCQWCLKNGIYNQAEEVHHLIHLNKDNLSDVNVTLNPDNLIALCRNCHIQHHKVEKRKAIARANKRKFVKRITNRDGTYLDETDGLLKKRKAHIVYGCPRSGKSTYVSKHKEPNDIVIDTDRLITALQGDDLRHKNQPILFLSLAVRDYLFELLEKESDMFDCHAVWIVGGFPDNSERHKLSSRLKADEILIECTEEEAKKRAIETNLYDNDAQYAVDIVHEWFNKHS